MAFGISPNNIGFGVDSVWQDIDFPIIVRTVAANKPTLATMQGNITAPQWAVNDYMDLEGQELIHGWKEGSTIHWHVHLVTNGSDGTDKYVKFTLEHTYASVNAALSTAATITTGDLLIPASTPDKTMLLLSIGTLALPSERIAGHIWARFTRIAASGAAPAANPWITMVQAHIECNSIGSLQIASKV